MAAGQPRRQLHGYVSAQARDGWYAFAEAHGTNVTALLEALGIELGKAAKKPPAQRPRCSVSSRERRSQSPANEAQGEDRTPDCGTGRRMDRRFTVSAL
jgi:hypothetical protein